MMLRALRWAVVPVGVVDVPRVKTIQSTLATPLPPWKTRYRSFTPDRPPTPVDCVWNVIHPPVLRVVSVPASWPVGLPTRTSMRRPPKPVPTATRALNDEAPVPKSTAEYFTHSPLSVWPMPQSWRVIPLAALYVPAWIVVNALRDPGDGVGLGDGVGDGVGVGVGDGAGSGEEPPGRLRFAPAPHAALPYSKAPMSGAEPA